MQHSTADPAWNKTITGMYIFIVPTFVWVVSKVKANLE